MFFSPEGPDFNLLNDGSAPGWWMNAAEHLVQYVVTLGILVEDGELQERDIQEHPRDRPPGELLRSPHTTPTTVKATVASAELFDCYWHTGVTTRWPQEVRKGAEHFIDILPQLPWSPPFCEPLAVHRGITIRDHCAHVC